MNYRVCLNKVTGRLIEMQSGGGTEHLSTLVQNAINAGWKAEDVVVTMVDDVGWKAIQDAEAATLPAEIKRKLEYNRLGATTEALTVALWEKVMEGRPGAADALQAIRAAVKGAII